MPYSDTLTINGLGLMCQDRLEEDRGTPGQFWTYPYEIDQLVCEALNEATLISGEPEIVAATIPLFPNTFIQPMPSFMTALLRVEFEGTPLLKTSLWHLDRFLPAWEQQPAQSTLGPDSAGNGPYWFPLGLNSFGIYPMVSAAQYVLLAGMAIPAVSQPSQGQLTPLATSAYNSFQFVVDPLFVGGVAQWSGGSVIQMTLPNGVTGSALQFTGASGAGVFSQTFPLVAGCNYTYSGWVKTGGAGTWQLFYANAAGGNIYNIGSPTAWTQVSQLIQAPGSLNLSQGQWGLVNTSATSDTINAWSPSVVNDQVPFQQEYGEAFADMAASGARLKDGSADLQQGLQQMKDFMAKMATLSRFGMRKSGLRFSPALGSVARVTDVEKRF